MGDRRQQKSEEPTVPAARPRGAQAQVAQGTREAPLRRRTVVVDRLPPGGPPRWNTLDPRLRRLLFRCWHRGIREMDLVLGRFADAHLASLTELELGEVERWLEVPDQQIFAWINGTETTPQDFNTALFRRLRDFDRQEDV